MHGVRGLMYVLERLPFPYRLPFRLEGSALGPEVGRMQARGRAVSSPRETNVRGKYMEAAGREESRSRVVQRAANARRRRRSRHALGSAEIKDMQENTSSV